MSTSFYWRPVGAGSAAVYPNGHVGEEDTEDPGVHIGTRYGLGRGSTVFVWAQRGAEVLEICRLKPGVRLVRDSAGRDYTGEEFVEALGFVEEFDDTMVGRRFT